MARILDRIKGHEKPISDLLGALSRERFAQTWIFAGPSGVGKKQVALGIAQALVCGEQPGLGCGVCGQCQRVEKQQSENLLMIAPEGRQIKVAQAQQILSFVHLQGIGRARAIIIDEAQLMNQNCANSLLKTLEEPPENTYFILLVRSISSLLTTIRSRAQIVSFSGLSRESLAAVKSFEPWVIAACGGSVERAEQLSGDGYKEFRDKAFNVLSRSMQGSVWSLADEIKELVKDKEVAGFAAATFEQWLRDILSYQLGGRQMINADQMPLIELGAQKYSTEIEEICDSCQNLQRDLNGNIDRTLSFENFLMQLSGEAKL